MEIYQNLQINLKQINLSKRLLFLRRYLYVFYLLPLSTYIFHVKTQLFVTLKSNMDPDPHCFGALDPDPH
jgi:hypothetical protein